MSRALYLGYGVHASHDERFNQLMLTVERANGVKHWIALTADELKRINEFAATLPPLTGVEK